MKKYWSKLALKNKNYTFLNEITPNTVTEEFVDILIESNLDEVISKIISFLSNRKFPNLLTYELILLVKPTIEYFKLPKEEINEENKGNQVTLTDIAVNQIIETIEYVLGTVSHAASYLCLWALSLAHAQLAKVFFDITLLGFIQSGSTFGMIFIKLFLY